MVNKANTLPGEDVSQFALMQVYNNNGIGPKRNTSGQTDTNSVMRRTDLL